MLVALLAKIKVKSAIAITKLLLMPRLIFLQITLWALMAMLVVLLLITKALFGIVAIMVGWDLN